MKSPRYFTPVEANRTLPLVKRIVFDILESGRQVRELSSNNAAADQNNPEITRLIGKLEAQIRELTQLGCQYKDWNFTIGLVDFPAIIEGQEVLLCWRSDEEKITHYHGMEDGYAGRQAIPATLLKSGATHPGVTTDSVSSA